MVRTANAMMRQAGRMALAALAATAASLGGAGEGVAQSAEEQQLRQTPVLFKADDLSYDRELQIITARGNVEFTQGERILLADTVTFNQRTDTVTASGNVSIRDVEGDVFFADYAELSGDLANGVARSIRIRLANDARIAAAGGRRIAGNRTEMRKAVYSACKSCPDNPNRAPIWQVKAYQAAHDKANKSVEYRDAFLEFFGIPVFYTPYLTHPDPSVKRKSGFLAPSYGSDSELGAILRAPYYWVINDQSDATLTPIYTTDEGPAFRGEYRNRFRHGEFDGDGSVTEGSTDDGSKDIRGHFDGTLKADLGETWRGKIDVEFASDDTYLRRYGISSEDTLTSQAQIEGFRGRTYATGSVIRFQGLRAEDESGQTPFIHPIMDYNYVGEPGDHGGRFSFDANLLALTRTRSTDTRRVSLKGGWELPHIGSAGEIVRVFASIQADGYWVNEVTDPDDPSRDLSGVTGRLFPQAGFEWRMPFVRREGRISQIVEPIAGVIIAPNDGNPDKVPNEDSLDFELDDTNIFSANRFTGLDRVEGGQRLFYGLRGAVYGANGGYSEAFLGQSFRPREDDTFPTGSGLRNEISDLIGRVQIAPTTGARLLYRFRLGIDDFNFQRNELSAAFGPRWAAVSASYLFSRQNDTTAEFPDREEITLSLRSQFLDYWAFTASTRRDLDAGDTIEHRFGLVYEDDCFTFTADFSRSFTQDRDVKPTDTFFFRVTLRTLGSVATGVNVGGE